MNRFFVDYEITNENNEIFITEQNDINHITKSLRLTQEDEIEIVDVKENLYISKIKMILKDKIVVDIICRGDFLAKSLPKIKLYQGMPKKDKLELIAQKTTEIGVNTITPVNFRHSVVEKLTENKLNRIVKIIKEAAMQSKRRNVPEFRELMEFDELLQDIKENDINIVFYESERRTGLREIFNKIDKKSLSTIGIIVGPEGGFHKEEIEILKNNHCHILTLGSTILRTETAAIVGCALVLYEAGNN